MNPTEHIASSGVAIAGAPSADVPAIELSGYELESLLGSGGYGEVWKATGPGGFPKAVKILYGHRDGEHAEAELKALNRMRGLRHPFILSIERVEVCSNRLVVVTELADCSLQERCEACRAEGKSGIPRDELLGYLRDAADALDFMYAEHGLQHLDIKPDNLLLQGNRVKLGDFGLAKDVSVTNVSLISGFTPMYSSPELFEGRPGQMSDQYSLAIVYQTMLTGKPPFNGRTAAQLTSQHLRSQPDLTPLAPADRPVIARALSKNPSARYSTCREMVDDLLNRSHSTRYVHKAAPSESQASSEPIDSRTTQHVGARAAVEAEPSVPADATLVPDRKHCLRPAVFVGVGGIGGRVLRQLKNAWTGTADSAIPAWQVLAIDTDTHSLSSVGGLPPAAQLADSETLPIRLRGSMEYRKAKNLDMSWLSRRWLFNIPRSGQVEGMRPLARLAVQDHLVDLKRRLRDCLNAAVDSDAVVQSAAAASTPFSDDELDVFIVAAISGGTGGGAAADVALIVQELLREFDGLKATVCGILLHGSGRTQRVEGVQTASTIASLKELRLLGMQEMGIQKGFTREAAELTPFDHSWLLHCGDQLTSAEFGDATDATARFLHRVTATPAATAWHHWRDAGGDDRAADGEPSIRLLGMADVDADVYGMAETEAASLATALMKQWLAPATGKGPVVSEAAQAVRELFTSLKLTETTLPGRIMEELRGETGREIEQLAEMLFQKICSDSGTEPVGQRLRAELQRTEDGSGGESLERLCAGVSRRLNRERQVAETQTRQLLRSLMGTSGRVGGDAMLKTLQQTLQATAIRCRQLRSEIDRAFADLDSLLATGAGDSCEDVLRDICRQFSVLSGSRAIYDIFQQWLQDFSGLTEVIATDLRAAEEKISGVIERIAARSPVHDGIPVPVRDAFRSRVSTAGEPEFKDLLAGDCTCEQFADRLTDFATGFLMSAGAGDESVASSFPASAWPKLQDIGGRHRLMAWLPADADEQRWKSRLVQEFSESVAVFRHSMQRVSVVCEVEGISSTRLLKHLQSADRAAWEMAERIHTRTDVHW